MGTIGVAWISRSTAAHWGSWVGTGDDRRHLVAFFTDINAIILTNPKFAIP